MPAQLSRSVRRYSDAQFRRNARAGAFLQLPSQAATPHESVAFRQIDSAVVRQMPAPEFLMWRGFSVFFHVYHVVKRKAASLPLCYEMDAPVQHATNHAHTAAAAATGRFDDH